MDTAMNCPKCESPLNNVLIKTRPEYGGDILRDAEAIRQMELDQCLSCNGVWFDAKELDQYLAEKLLILESPKVKDSDALNRKIGKCPKCGLAMEKKDAPKDTFDIDACKACGGIWLDSTEIDRLSLKNISFTEKHALIIKNLRRVFGVNGGVPPRDTH